MKKLEWFKYVITFCITAGIFLTVFYTTSVINQKKISQLNTIQDKISIDLLSSETQFALLKQSACTDDGTSILAPEIGELGEKLSVMETTLGIDDARVIQLKKYYSLLQIKDYILMTELAKKCSFKPITIVYFYSNECDECANQATVLTALRAKYPELRVYSFDADLDLSAIDTFKTMSHATRDSYPVTVINGKSYTKFQSLETIEKLIPELKKMMLDMTEKTVKKKTENS